MKRLLLVDGSNVLMRAAFGGEVEPSKAAPVAAGMIRRAAKQVGASHLVVAIDSPQPSWRKVLYPEYKAQRDTDTTAWLLSGFQQFTRLGWYVLDAGGFEADDIIATIARRAIGRKAECRMQNEETEVVVLSGDSDLMPLAGEGVTILRPETGGVFKPMDAAAVCAEYKIPETKFLTDFKALTGDKGDNVPGVPGIGPVRASSLLNHYGRLPIILKAGEVKTCKHSTLVHAHRAAAELAFKLLSLSYDVPIPPIQPSGCAFNPEART